MALSVKEIRERSGLNQKEFADELGKTPEMISRYERGKSNTRFIQKDLEKFMEKYNIVDDTDGLPKKKISDVLVRAEYAIYNIQKIIDELSKYR